MKRGAARKKGLFSQNEAFSMVEMIVVIGIIGVIVSVGAVSYINQISQSRVDTAARIIDANLRQARQLSISMRQNRRVAIDAGELDGFSQNKLTGTRIRRAAIWIEGKRNKAYDFETHIPKGGGYTGTMPNAYPLGDTDYLPENVMIADVDNRIPGIDNPDIFYIEFNTRGAIQKVYFDGEEGQTGYNEIAPVIHLARDAEVFTIDGMDYNYVDAVQKAGNPSFLWGGDNAKERYKIYTLEVIRLTGRTRRYDFAIMNPWPLDEPPESE